MRRLLAVAAAERERVSALGARQQKMQQIAVDRLHDQSDDRAKLRSSAVS
ncbi:MULTISPECIES: hypothetical protein [unclassified Sphingomonas]|nr:MULTISPECIES: hypothetical protein [unclassified Sphingomonas]